jgi:hypothetical protein
MNLDHKILFMLGAKPINIKPYRSFFIHKDEEEKLVKEMLTNGVTQYSFSPLCISNPLS